jgi:hypothetical protein
MGLGLKPFGTRYRKRGARIMKNDRASWQASVYMVYATIIRPENV